MKKNLSLQKLRRLKGKRTKIRRKPMIKRRKKMQKLSKKKKELMMKTIGETLNDFSISKEKFR